MDETVINKGEHFILSTGEYSDYDIEAYCEALEDIDTEQVMQEFKEQGYEDEVIESTMDCMPDYRRERYTFLHFLFNIKKVAKELPYKEFYYNLPFALTVPETKFDRHHTHLLINKRGES